MLKKFRSAWFLLRLSMLLAAVVVSPLFYRQMHQEFDNDSFSWTFIFVLLGLVIASILFVLSLQYKNPLSPEQWRRPSWEANPLDFRQPIQSFHTAGWIFIVLGVSVAIYTVMIGALSLVFLFPLTVGVGVIIGVKLSTLVFRAKFTSDRSELN